MASGFAMTGADIDDLVGGHHDRGFVFDHDDGIPGITQPMENADESPRIAWVQADTRFIENEEGLDEASSETGGEVDPFGLAAAESAGGAVEGEVTEANFLQIAEARFDLYEHDAERIGTTGMLRCEASDQSQRVANGQLIEIGNGKGRRGASSVRHLQTIKE